MHQEQGDSLQSGQLVTLRELLPAAERGGYAVGSFAPRYLPMIRYVLRAAQALRSPVIVQISGNELQWFSTSPREFADEFWNALWTERVTVPVALHLDHTRDMDRIADAIAAGFTSVMIDRSDLPLAGNIAASRAVAEYAHERGASVEAELGRILSVDQIETAEDTELMTVPEEAEQYVLETGVDALAVSVGTAHGSYGAREPYIDLERLAAIRAACPAPLVLHGGSGIPVELIRQSILLPGGGVSKVNIATDLEQAMLSELGWNRRTSNAVLAALPRRELDRAGEAVMRVVQEKIRRFLGSAGTA